MKMKLVSLFACLFSGLVLQAQETSGYLVPPKAVADMLLAKPAPLVMVNATGTWMVIAETSQYPSVEEMAKPELKIAGLRINPASFSPSRQNAVAALYVKNLASDKEQRILGLPTPLKAGSVSWSPDGKHLAFTHTRNDGVDLYVAEAPAFVAKKWNTLPLNTVFGSYSWTDANQLQYFAAIKPATAAPKRPLAPSGPTIQSNEGKASPRPTFQDLIKSPYDESLFAFYATTQLVLNKQGIETRIGKPAIYAGARLSPNKKYWVLQTIQTPFSYLVPAYGFPRQVAIANEQGQVIKTLFQLPSQETAPSGYDNVQNVPADFEWRGDVPATLTWTVPLDSGMLKKQVPFRDALLALPAPFNGQADTVCKTTHRFQSVVWGNDKLALLSQGLRSKQITQLSKLNPGTGAVETILTRNTTDAYANPGTVVTSRNANGQYLIELVNNGQAILFNNRVGSSPNGDLPYLAQYNLATNRFDTLWRSAAGSYEYVVDVLDAQKLELLTRSETKADYPNYWIKNLKLRIADRKLTQFANPYPQLAGVTKEKIRYQRKDGIQLTGDLYLPAGYNKERDGKLPTLIWAYPAEYQSAADAAQVRGSEHRFTMLNWGSPIFYVTQGYAVLNNAEMPIVSSGKDKKPNDDFVEQLTMNAEAAIKKLWDMGVGDSARMAVGGHSYGAFMTANLLAHTNLFKAGIARSGAYNRSLTPFGFQNEDRTYWQAPELYFNMSPFSFAHKIKTPLLMLHGDADNNTGTFPIQSERLFNAIKGHGGTVRFVSLPFESHGYQGRENVLHTLAEQFNWLEKYVK